jgi:hypothetical protein
MRNFYPGTHVYDIAEQIYRIVGTSPFLYKDIAEKLDVTPGDLSRLRFWGVVKNPAGELVTERWEEDEQRRSGQPRVRYWVLTPVAVEAIQRYLRRLQEGETAE